MKNKYIMLLTSDGIYHVELHLHDVPPSEIIRPIHPDVQRLVARMEKGADYTPIKHRRYLRAGWITEAGVEMPLYQEVAE